MSVARGTRACAARSAPSAITSAACSVLTPAGRRRGTRRLKRGAAQIGRAPDGERGGAAERVQGDLGPFAEPDDCLQRQTAEDVHRAALAEHTRAEGARDLARGAAAELALDGWGVVLGDEGHLEADRAGLIISAGQGDGEGQVGHVPEVYAGRRHADRHTAGVKRHADRHLGVTKG